MLLVISLVLKKDAVERFRLVDHKCIAEWITKYCTTVCRRNLTVGHTRRCGNIKQLNYLSIKPPPFNGQFLGEPGLPCLPLSFAFTLFRKDLCGYMVFLWAECTVLPVIRLTVSMQETKTKISEDDVLCVFDKKLSYRRGTVRCVVSVEILPTAMQQCSTTSPEQIEVMKLEG